MLFTHSARNKGDEKIFLLMFVEGKQGTRNWAETIIDITRSVYFTNITFLLTKHGEEIFF